MREEDENDPPVDPITEALEPEQHTGDPDGDGITEPWCEFCGVDHRTVEGGLHRQKKPSLVKVAGKELDLCAKCDRDRNEVERELSGSSRDGLREKIRAEWRAEFPAATFAGEDE